MGSLLSLGYPLKDLIELFRSIGLQSRRDGLFAEVRGRVVGKRNHPGILGVVSHAVEIERPTFELYLESGRMFDRLSERILVGIFGCREVIADEIRVNR